MAGSEAWSQIPSAMAELHLALDAHSGEIIAHVVTDQGAGDVTQLQALLDQIGEPIGQFTADGAYDGTAPQPIPRHWNRSRRHLESLHAL
jgi:IS5 family transposase